MKIQVEVWESHYAMRTDIRRKLIRRYVMDHDSQEQRRVLGEQCRNAFEAGQLIVTYPI